MVFINGRNFHLLLSDAAYTSAGLVDLENMTDDVNIEDSAAEATVEARDIIYALSQLGIKTFSLDGSILMRKTNGAGAALMQTSYDNTSPLYCVGLPGPKTVSGLSGRKFVATVQQWKPVFPANGPAKWSYKLVLTDGDNLPARVTTPLS